MSVDVGQRRIMPNGDYVTVVGVGPERTGSQGQYVVTLYITACRQEVTRAYGTVNTWPHTPCLNERHASIQDCVRACAWGSRALGRCTMAPDA